MKLPTASKHTSVIRISNFPPGSSPGARFPPPQHSEFDSPVYRYDGTRNVAAGPITLRPRRRNLLAPLGSFPCLWFRSEPINLPGSANWTLNLAGS